MLRFEYKDSECFISFLLKTNLKFQVEEGRVMNDKRPIKFLFTLFKFIKADQRVSSSLFYGLFMSRPCFCT